MVCSVLAQCPAFFISLVHFFFSSLDSPAGCSVFGAATGGEMGCVFSAKVFTPSSSRQQKITPIITSTHVGGSSPLPVVTPLHLPSPDAGFFLSACAFFCSSALLLMLSMWRGSFG